MQLDIDILSYIHSCDKWSLSVVAKLFSITADAIIERERERQREREREREKLFLRGNNLCTIFTIHAQASAIY